MPNYATRPRYWLSTLVSVAKTLAGPKYFFFLERMRRFGFGDLLSPIEHQLLRIEKLGFTMSRTNSRFQTPFCLFIQKRSFSFNHGVDILAKIPQILRIPGGKTCHDYPSHPKHQSLQGYARWRGENPSNYWS